jgi:hypothetical protein
MKDLSNKYSSVYMNSILLEALKEYNLEYGITRQVYLFNFN